MEAPGEFAVSMAHLPSWLPPLIRLEDSGGDWPNYVEKVYRIFHRDFIESQPQFNSLWGRCRHDPIYDGKEAGFWHCISTGRDEQNRVPDPRRCEHIAWIRAIIDHASHPAVSCWRNRRGSDKRQLLWLREDFLVVFAFRECRRDGSRYLQVLTSYPTTEPHRIRKLRAERDTLQNG